MSTVHDQTMIKERDIDFYEQTENGVVPLRYLVLEQMNFLDFLQNVPNEAYKLYNQIGFSLHNYEERVGCFGMIYFDKFRDQGEIEYDRLVGKFKCRKHAIWTHVTKNYGFSSWPFSSKEKECQELRHKQSLQLETIAKIARDSNLFTKVLVPSDRFLIEKLKYPPQLIACTDRILLCYKKVKRTINHSELVLPVVRTSLQNNQRVRIEFDKQRSYRQQFSDNLYNQTHRIELDDDFFEEELFSQPNQVRLEEYEAKTE